MMEGETLESRVAGLENRVKDLTGLAATNGSVRRVGRSTAVRSRSAWDVVSES